MVAKKAVAAAAPVPVPVANVAADDNKLDYKAVSGMLGVLKYHAKNESSARHDESKNALEIYKALSDTSARQSFLASFDEAGKGKVAGSLKFALEFRQSISASKKSEVGITEDFFTRPVCVRKSPVQETAYIIITNVRCHYISKQRTLFIIQRPQILQFMGLALSDFAETKIALKTADDFIAENKAEYGHKQEPKIHTNPLVSKYFYVKSHGKKRSWEQTENKEFGGSADPKTRKNMQEVGAFMECFGDTGGEAASSSVKVEFVAHSKLLQAKDSCRSQ
jgi:hypothetical protein